MKYETQNGELTSTYQTKLYFVLIQAAEGA